MDSPGVSIPNFGKSFALQLTLLGVAALVYSLVPVWVSERPLAQLLSSDAEFYAHGMRTMSGVGSAGLELPVDTKPMGEKMFSAALGKLATALGWDLLAFSVYFSFGVLLLFLGAVFALCQLTFGGGLWPFYITLFCILPVHVLGGTSFGFSALGWLPRDLALALAVGILAGYVWAKQRGRGLVWVFAACGLCANYYSICFVHLALVLLLAEVIASRGIPLRLIGYGLVWVVAALPAIVDFVSKSGLWSPVDIEIMRMRNGFMIASGWESLTRYLRRFLLHCVMAGAGAYWLQKFGSQSERSRSRIWIEIALASFVWSIVGLVIEANTEYLRLFISRTSLFLTLAAMILFPWGLGVWLRHRGVARAGAWAAVVVIPLLLVQSNLTSVGRYLIELHRTKEEKKQFFKAVKELSSKAPESVLVLAPTPEMDDIAASLRTYANRSIYVSYKDGGVSLVDGERARRWLGRLRKQEAALEMPADAFVAFLRAERIDVAFLPASHRLAPALRGRGDVESLGHPVGFEIFRVK